MVRNEALSGDAPCLSPAADRDRVTSVLGEQRGGHLGIGVAFSEHGDRHSLVGQLPAGLEPIDWYVYRTRDVPELELRSVANVDHHVISVRRGEIVGLN
jgi:hypothetical protein